MNSFKQIDSIASNNWQKFLDGDREALGSIFSQYFRDLVAYGMKIIGSDDLAKDHVQELFVRLWEKRSQLRSVQNVKVYLLISLRNDLLKTMRTKRPDTLDLTFQNNLFVISSEDFIIEKEQEFELAGKVALCLEKLTARQREVVYLRFYMNLDFLSLAEVMGMNVQSVRNLLFRTLERIRKEVDSIQQSGNIELILFRLFGHRDSRTW